MKSAAYFVDVTFDGNLDLLVPCERTWRYISFSAFLWDDSSRQFIENPSFEMVYNPSIDPVGKRILSTTSGNQIVSYGIFVFENNEFILTNSLGWMPAGLAVEPVIEDADSFINFTEYLWDDGNSTIVNDFYVLGGAYAFNVFGEQPSSFHDSLHPQVKPYFEHESFWDLSNLKWKSWFLKELK